MSKTVSVFLLFSLLVTGISAQDIFYLDLQSSIKMANDSSLSAFRNENMYRAGYWEYRSYKAARLPSLMLSLIPAQYNRVITRRYDSQQDIDVFREQQSYNANVGLSIIQNFDWLGGTFYIESNFDYLLNHVKEEMDPLFSAVPFRIGYEQKLLGFNSFRWERKIEPLKYEKVKKQYLYNTELVSEEVIKYFFELLMAEIEFAMAEDNVASADTLYGIGIQRQKIASISQADLLTLELDKINAQNSLHNAKVAHKRAMSDLATYLNIDKNKQIKLILPERPDYVDIPLGKAVMMARQNNPIYLEEQQNVLESEREVSQARQERMFNASLRASIGFNQTAGSFKGVYKNLLQQDLVQLSVSVPLVDWGVRKGKYNMAQNNLNVAKIAARQKEIQMEEEVIMTINDFYVQQELISSTEKALNLAERAYDQTRRHFITGKADINSITMAQNRQKEAQRNFIMALKMFWLDYYKIRRLTLFDFVSDLSLSQIFDFDSLK